MRLEVVLVTAVFSIGVACRDDPPPPPVEAAPIPGMLPHGDHSPRYGGTVWMHGDLHFEVVLEASGEHRVYFSDAARVELPAAVASDVSLVVSRPGEEPETLELEIDEFGESWIAEGHAVDDPETRVLVSFRYEGEPYEIDLPFVAEPPDPNAPDPHAVP